MPKTVRFHEAAYHNEYGYFARDSVYDGIPDDFVIPGGAEEISRDQIGPLDNVRVKDYSGLITSGVTKKVVNAKTAAKTQAPRPTGRRPEAIAPKSKTLQLQPA